MDLPGRCPGPAPRAARLRHDGLLPHPTRGHAPLDPVAAARFGVMTL